MTDRTYGPRRYDISGDYMYHENADGWRIPGHSGVGTPMGPREIALIEEHNAKIKAQRQEA